MGHSSATFLLLAGLSQVQEVPGFTLSWINKVISPDGCSASFVLEKVRCCKCAASSGALWILFLSRPLARHITCPGDGNVLYNKWPGAMWLHQWRGDIWTISNIPEPAALGHAHPADRLQKFGQTWVMFIYSLCWKSYTPWQSDSTKRSIILCPKKLDVCTGVLTPKTQNSFPRYRLLLKRACQTAISPPGRFSVLPSNAEQLALQFRLRITPLVSWTNQLIPSRVTQLKFLLQTLTQSSPCPCLGLCLEGWGKPCPLSQTPPFWLWLPIQSMLQAASSVCHTHSQLMHSQPLPDSLWHRWSVGLAQGWWLALLTLPHAFPAVCCCTV